jgi:hypothetical protein
MMFFSFFGASYGQDEEALKNYMITDVKKKLSVLKESFDKKLADYKSKLDELDNGKLDPEIDYNKIRDEAIKIQADLLKICSDKEAYKIAYKDLLTKKDFEDLFDDDACKDVVGLEEKKAGDDKQTEHLTYLNAYNFDFNDTNNSGYLGHLNAFFSLNSKDTWKINTGIMKINYTSVSTLNKSNSQIDSVLIKPLDVIVPGSKYLKEYNVYNKNLKITSYSAYIQLMRKVWKSDNGLSNVFVHGHMELLISDTEYTTEITNIQRDTVVATGENIDNTKFKQMISAKASEKNTFYGGYFGIGGTGDFKVCDTNAFSLNFFTQITLGLTNIQPGSGRSSIGDMDINNTADLSANMSSEHHFFHLIHSYFNSNFDGLNLIIGAQIRGPFEAPPLYAFYVGINTDLNKISALFN